MSLPPRYSLDAEQILNTLPAEKRKRAEHLLKQMGKPFISSKDVKSVLAKLPDPIPSPASSSSTSPLPNSKVEDVKEQSGGVEEKVDPPISTTKTVKVVGRTPRTPPIAAEYDADIEFDHTRDVTGKSRGKGTVDDFVRYFRDRYKRMAKLFHSTQVPTVHIEDLGSEVGNTVRIIAMVYDTRITKNGNLLLEVEDLTGRFNVIVSKKNDVLLDKCNCILRDEVLSFEGKVTEHFLIANEVDWPDIPQRSHFATSRRGLDLAALYLSDTHFGSKLVIHDYVEKALKWLNSGSQEAGRIKYVVFVGDIVDGIGIYPGQEEELDIYDIGGQYAEFNKFVEQLPDWMEVIVIPGNHDAVRRAEPMPAISKDLITVDVHLAGNPTWVRLDGINHVLYHGTSMSSLISKLSWLTYNEPEKVIKEYLKRRHLSSEYGANLIVPEPVDYFVLEDVPDVIVCGHTHKNGYLTYRGTHVISSGTFQDQTIYQKMQGHVPLPGVGAYLELKTSTFKTVDFRK